MSTHGWIGVDLDGTLAHYDGWVHEHHIGAPVPLMVERVKKLLAEGADVRIMTARVHSEAAASALNIEVSDIAKIVTTIQDWTEQHLGVRLPVTNAKDYAMLALYDDRAIQIIPNTGLRADGLP